MIDKLKIWPKNVTNQIFQRLYFLFSVIVCYARELKEHFVEYTEETVKLMVPMLKFYFHDGVRSAAAESLPCLIECAQIRYDFYFKNLTKSM